MSARAVMAPPACHNCRHAGATKVCVGPPPMPCVRCGATRARNAQFGAAAEWKSPGGWCPLHEFAAEAEGV